MISSEEVFSLKTPNLPLNVAPQAIQFLCNSRTQSSRFTFEMATALGLNTRWLAIGEEEMFLADDPKHQFSKSYARIPLLQLHQQKKLFLSNSRVC